jgi:hypothetical protein
MCIFFVLPNNQVDKYISELFYSIHMFLDYYRNLKDYTSFRIELKYFYKRGLEKKKKNQTKIVLTAKEIHFTINKRILRIDENYT